MCNLRREDLIFGKEGPAPGCRPYIEARLSERKGWMKKAGSDKGASQAYDIYQQPMNPEIDAFTHLTLWIDFYESYLHRKLQPMEYVFPYIAPNGIIHPNRPNTLDGVQTLLNTLTDRAELGKKLTTHCFRRGGAQYRFMWAVDEERWNLKVVQWWGGWIASAGEAPDSLVKYLIDALYHEENSFQGAMRPRDIHPDIPSVKGCELTLPSPDTISSLDGKFSDMKISFLKEIEGIKDLLREKNSSAPSTSPLSSLPYPLAPPQTSTVPTQPTSSALNDSGAAGNATTSAFPTGLFIPDLPRGGNGWKQAVAQWETGEGGLGIPLRDWPKEWYTGAMKQKFGAKRGQRKLIAEAYERCGRNDSIFLSTYPSALRGVRYLLEDIRRQYEGCEQRTSKNGRPDQRRDTAGK